MDLRIMLRYTIIAAAVLLGACTTTGSPPNQQLTLHHAGGRLVLPLTQFAGATLVGDLSIIFADGSTARIESLYAEDLGYDLDIRDYPAYLLGLKALESTSALSASDREEILLARDQLFHGGDEDITLFTTSRGYSYVVLGDRQHFALLIDKNNATAITLVALEGMSRDVALINLMEENRSCKARYLNGRRMSCSSS